MAHDNNVEEFAELKIKDKLVVKSNVNISFDNGQPIVVPRKMKRNKPKDRAYTAKNYEYKLKRKDNAFTGHNKYEANDPMLTYAQVVTNNPNLTQKELRKMSEDEIKALMNKGDKE